MVFSSIIGLTVSRPASNCLSKPYCIVRGFAQNTKRFLFAVFVVCPVGEKAPVLLHDAEDRLEFFALGHLQQFEQRSLNAGNACAGILHFRQADGFVARRAR